MPVPYPPTTSTTPTTRWSPSTASVSRNARSAWSHNASSPTTFAAATTPTTTQFRRSGPTSTSTSPAAPHGALCSARPRSPATPGWRGQVAAQSLRICWTAVRAGCAVGGGGVRAAARRGDRGRDDRLSHASSERRSLPLRPSPTDGLLIRGGGTHTAVEGADPPGTFHHAAPAPRQDPVVDREERAAGDPPTPLRLSSPAMSSPDRIVALFSWLRNRRPMKLSPTVKPGSAQTSS
jgi:hypothetical protein